MQKRHLEQQLPVPLERQPALALLHLGQDQGVFRSGYPRLHPVRPLVGYHLQEVGHSEPPTNPLVLRETR